MELYEDESRKIPIDTVHFLRQQMKKRSGKANMCLADFVAPKKTGIKDYIGGFAVTTGIGIEEKIELFKNNQMVLDSKEVAQAYDNTKGALYVFWQPYKLIDSNARLDYVGLVTLLDSISVHSVKVSYPLDPAADVWNYYFNEENFMLEATEVNHDGRISLIINESVEDKTGLFLNKTRKSYFVDSLGKIKYLRAAYKYTITSFN